MHTPSSSKRLLLVGALLGSALGGIVGLGNAHAQITTCRTDPLITLSNGRIYDLSADIQDTAGDIASVTYTLIGPVGTHVVSIQKTPGPLSGKEHVTYIAGNDPGTYDATIYVDTVNNDARVAAHYYLANNTNTILSIETIKNWAQNDIDSEFFDTSSSPRAVTSPQSASTTPLPSPTNPPTTINSWMSLLNQLFGSVTCGCTSPAGGNGQ